MAETPIRSLLVLSLFAAPACAHKSAAPDFAYDRTADFAALGSYAWSDDPRWIMPGGDAIVDGPFIDRGVRSAVDAGLVSKGFRRVEKNPSFYVEYFEGSGEGLSQDKWDDRWAAGARWTSDDMSQNIFSTATPAPDSDPTFVADSGTKYRKQSTLVLEIRDSRKNLIWRASRTSLTGTNPEDVRRHLDRAVASLLARFPPKMAARAQ